MVHLLAPALLRLKSGTGADEREVARASSSGSLFSRA